MVLTTLFTESFAHHGEDRRSTGDFATPAHAHQAVIMQIDEDLRSYLQTGQSALALFDLWSVFGDDVFIVPDSAIRPFSATDYARLRCVQFTADASRPLVLEAHCCG